MAKKNKDNRPPNDKKSDSDEQSKDTQPSGGIDLLTTHFMIKDGAAPDDEDSPLCERDWHKNPGWREAALMASRRRQRRIRRRRDKWRSDDEDWRQDDESWRMSAAVSVGRRGQKLTSRLSALGMPRNYRSGRVVTLGWHPDLPDYRDRVLPPFASDACDSCDHVRNKRDENLLRVLRDKMSPLVTNAPISDSHLNIDYCSPIEDQGQLGSCTAQAVVGLMEYMMRRGRGQYIDGSRLFLYKVTRNLHGWTGDTGAYVRTAMKAAVTFGIPPEEHWPYDVDVFEDEPTAFLYSYASNYQVLNYARIDTPDISTDEVIDRVLRTLESGFCLAFGFTVFDSLTDEPDIRFPDPEFDSVSGGHAVVAVGYDLNHEVDGEVVPSLVIRNSWGLDWGVEGYGYLPLAYIEHGLARDFWTVYDWEWIRDGDFS